MNDSGEIILRPDCLGIGGENADSIVFISNTGYKEERFSGMWDAEIVDVMLLKEQIGATGIVKLAFGRRYLRFSNWMPE